MKRLFGLCLALSLVGAFAGCEKKDEIKKETTVTTPEGERYETVLTDRDLVSVPPGVYREEINVGDEDALMCVMLGAKKPITPTYPPEHPLAKIKR